MEIRIESARLQDINQECLVAFAYRAKGKSEKSRLKWEEALSPLEKQLKRLEQLEIFSGEKEEVIFLRDQAIGKCSHILLVGLGKFEDSSLELLRRVAGVASRKLKGEKVKSAGLFFPSIAIKKDWDFVEATQSITEGFRLSLYEFNMFKTKNGESKPLKLGEVSFVVKERDLEHAKEGLRIGTITAEAQALARDLGNMPANKLVPADFAEQAKKIAKEFNLKITVLEKGEIEKEGMGGLLAVSQGSIHPPRFIVVEYHPKRAKKTLALVGKGITFDSGGISIKPSEKMEEMKYDMCGAAAVLCAIRAISQRKLPIHVVSIMALAENLPSGTAIIPSSVIVASSGKTIEVANTDAEGRLVLSDALHYAGRYKPDVVVDIATLTGACSMALGRACCGVIGNDKVLIQQIHELGEKVGERAWPLPLYEEYRDDIKSDVADVKNIGKGRGAGASTGAAFLEHFVPEDTSWVHFDIAGVAWSTSADLSSYVPKGGTGFGVRLLTELAKFLCEE